MQKEAGVRQAVTTILATREEDESAGAGNPASADDTNRSDIINEADHIMDSIAALDVSAGRVDV